MKFQRQAKILELIDRFEIETQEELTDHLRAVGYSTTQATVSRDIKELRLIKSLSTETGKYKYTAAAAGAADSFTTRLRNIFRECVTDIDAAQNMVVIKTLPGLGQAAAMVGDRRDARGGCGRHTGRRRHGFRRHARYRERRAVFQTGA